MQFLSRRQATQQNWWLLAFSGIVAIFFGIAIMVWPQLSVTIFVYLFGTAVVLYGICLISLSFARPRPPGWWILPVGGLLSIIVGIVTFIFPLTTGKFLLVLVALWAILMGIVALAHAISSAPSAIHRWLFVLAGLLSIFLGVFLLIRPTAILSIVWLIGAFSIVYGALLLISVLFPGKANEPAL